jgi:hypothetical protein
MVVVSQTVLESPCATEPQLVINLLESGGFGDWTSMRKPDDWAKLNTRWAPGVRATAPFESSEEERAAEMRLDLFMSDILIPLAAQTRAVVICCAIPNLCILSASFTRMFNAVKAKWPGKPPFTVLSTTNDMIALYSSNKYPVVPPGASWSQPKDTPLEMRYVGKVWKQIMSESRMWKQRHERIASALDKITETPLDCDLDGNVRRRLRRAPRLERSNALAATHPSWQMANIRAFSLVAGLLVPDR